MIEVAKFLANSLALLLALPAVVIYHLGAILLGREKAFFGWSEAFSLLPGLSGIYLRHAFYRCVLPRCGTGACLRFGTIISHPFAEIGKNVYTGPHCSLGNVTLENNVLLGSHVSVMNGSNQHCIDRLDIPIREQSGIWPRVSIGQDAWIGDRAIVMADVGNHCVIGAGSIVSKPIPDFAIAVGTPAKIVRYREGSPPERARENGSCAYASNSISSATAN